MKAPRNRARNRDAYIRRGGSYLLNPKTGKRKLIERTRILSTEEQIASESDEIKRLRADARVSSVLRELQEEGGATSFQIHCILKRIVALPAEWRVYGLETARQRKEQQSRLPVKLRKLAAALEADPTGRTIYIDGHNAVFFGGGIFIRSDRPSLAEYLRFTADSLEKGSAQMYALAESEGKTLRRRVTLENYVLQNVYQSISPFFARPSPNSQVEKIASALLKRNIKPGTFAHLRRNKLSRPHE